MELSPKQQINDLVKASEKILVLSHTNLGGDAVGGMLALDRVLTKMGKEVSVVASENPEEFLCFLPGIEKLKKDISGTRDFIIQLDKEKIGIEKLSYNEEGNLLNIIISPKEGQIASNDVKMLQGNFKFDLIFVLDSPDVAKIDSVYDRHTELFFETPIINIDHHAGNEYFGTVNMIDQTATSTCEILVSIIESLGAGNFDEDVATCLLTGIVADTGSFKNTNTTPKSLTISAQMLAAGARQQEVITNLYKARPLNTLKLWGKILSRIELDKKHKMVWSYANYNEIQENGASLEDLRNLMDELLASTPGADVVLLLAEEENGKVAGKLKGLNGQDVLGIAELFGGSGVTSSAGFEVRQAPFKDAVWDIIAKVQDLRAAQLGFSTENAKPVVEEKPAKPVEKEIPKAETQRTEANNHIKESEIREEKTEDVEVKDLFDRFIGANNEPVNTEGHVEEAKEVPAVDPIVQAIESLENEPVAEEITEEAPSIDIEEVKTQDNPFHALGDILKDHNPVSHEGEQLKDKAEDIRTWKEDEEA